MRQASIISVGVFLLAGTAEAQTPPPATFSPAGMAAYADSFVTILEGTPQGWHRYALTRSDTEWRFTDEFAIGSFLTGSSTVTLTPRLGVTSARSSSHAFGQDTGAELRYEGRHATGWALIRGDSKPSRIVIDTVLPAEAFDGHALIALLGLMEWRVGEAHSLVMFDTDENSITTQTLRVAIRETITVPAGTFDTYRADLTTTQAPVRLWYTVASPHRLIKISDAANTFADVLVSRARQ